MHGYQLSKRLAATLGAFWKVSYGSLYPALKRLEREGAVESVFPRGARERIDNYTLSLMEHGEAATQQDIKWLDDLIRAERKQVRDESKSERGTSRRRSSITAKERAG